MMSISCSVSFPNSSAAGDLGICFLADAVILESGEGFTSGTGESAATGALEVLAGMECVEWGAVELAMVVWWWVL